MIDYLEQLVEEKKFREALSLSEQLIRDVKDSHEFVRVSAARTVSQCMLGQEEQALAAGAVAMETAQAIQDWDSFGVLSLFLGIAYVRVNQYQEAANKLYAYLGHLGDYSCVEEREQTAWFNLGIAWFGLKETVEGTRSMTKAFRVALTRGDHRYAHGVRQSLIAFQLRLGTLDDVPRLLAQCGHYLRHHPEALAYKLSWANHVRLSAEYKMSTNRLNRAIVIATRALSNVQGESDLEFFFHTVLAKIARLSGSPEEALGHALAARTCARTCRRSDWEGDAGELLRSIMQESPQSIELVEKHYLLA